MGATDVDDAGVSAVEAREGLKLVAYLDTVGVPTVGVGHTGRSSPPAVHMGMRITETQARQFLKADAAPVADAVRGLGVDLTQNQFNALVSFGFNVGVEGLEKSTVAKRLRAHDVQGAADALLLWNKPPEVLGRRRQERAQFLRPDGEAHPSVASPTSVVSDVKSLQAFLQLTGDYTGSADGDFGPKTEAAVRKFQAKCGLTSDGVVGPKTYAAMDAEVASRDQARGPAPVGHEAQGTAPDTGAAAHELQGRQPVSVLRRLWAAITSELHL